MTHKKKNKGQENEDTSSSETERPYGNFYYKDVAELTGAGGWTVLFNEKKSFLDPQARKILETPEDYRPSLRTALDFYSDEYKARAAEAFMACSMGTPFNATVKMLRYNKQEFWAKAVGRPIYGENNEIVGIQGVFQDIDEEKLKELSLETSVKVIESQNSRLFNFAHIVSHNLRSHASNLSLTLDLLKSIDDATEEEELKSSLYQISESLNETINHLNEIVTAQAQSLDDRRLLNFDHVLQSTLSSISRMIEDTQTEIYSDFSEVPEIRYIPSYMESIFLNLITNAIKYRHPDRSPVIDICSYYEDERVCLMVKDNGLGIDLEKHGNDLFNMYQTFHTGKESVGIGLFITKNQIETLQGSIHVESKVDEGTTFKITF
ncbi:PAS domain-containing sensor histidine kinase [Aureisphaera galaxeae]|uniref:PAS domain-containing sensor histidine kinase n=1 Tax=Aureisphaera galaxeae TaxID=1538023 RepID=UPI0023509F83|nr:PAS domain-containing sensor histidine kinase [Aureisphaera galaxeae]MDC8002546.1 PAS domain-containing sensor histidine kinase [Aureisphaera galaxeae]